MPTFIVTSPDGKEWEVDGPEGSTQEQAIEYVKGQFGTAQESAPVDFSTLEMVKNIPGSAVQYGKNLAQPFIHPIDTAKAMGSLFTSEDARSQVGQFIKDRYGSEDAFKRTLMEDPVGVLADASMVVTGGGAALSRVPGVVGKAGNVVKNVGLSAEPLNALKIPGRAVAKMLPDDLPAKIYQSGAKFSTKFTPEQRVKMANTAIDQGITLNTKGVDKLNSAMNVLDTKIDDLISKATDTGVMIPKDAIYRHLKEVRKNLGGPKMRAAENLRQVDRVAKAFDVHMKSIGRDFLTPDELQAFKRDAYKELNFDAKQFAAKRGADEAGKAMARAAKESLEKVAPGIKDINRQYGDLVELSEPLKQSVNRIDNLNFLGLGAPAKIGAGGIAGGYPGAVAGTAAALLELPNTKANIAIKIRAMQQAGLLDQPTLSTLARYGLLQSGQVSGLLD